MRSARSERVRGAARAAGWVKKPTGWFCVMGCLLVLGLAAGAGMLCVNAQQSTFELPAISPPGSGSKPAADGSNPHAGPGGPATGKQTVTKQCADLLKMAMELKVEVDKTSKDTLSVTVVRKADEIEQYARKVRLGDGKS